MGQSLPVLLRKSLELAQESGASAWLTSLPIEEFGFTLHKGAFHDALAIRYNWPPQHAPSFCACGTKFSLEHSLSCPKGRFPSIRHNEIRDLTANLLTEVCSDVWIEPSLQPLSGETLQGASSNIQNDVVSILRLQLCTVCNQLLMQSDHSLSYMYLMRLA